MTHLLRSKTFYLGVSFVLLLASLPLISAGAMAEAEGAGTSALLWAGTASGALGTLVLPLQRFLTGTDRTWDEDE